MTDFEFRGRLRRLNDYRETIAEIWRLGTDYRDDMRDYASLSPAEFWQVLKALPFQDDPQGIETVSRPAFTMRPDWTGPRDCDDKATASVAYFALKGLLNHVRLAVVGELDWPHHIYPEFYSGREWLSFDATYPESELWKPIYDRPGFYQTYRPPMLLLLRS